MGGGRGGRRGSAAPEGGVPRDASGAMMAAKVKVEKPGSRWRRSRGRRPGRPPNKEASAQRPGKRPPGRFPQQRRKKRREGGEGLETPPQKQNSFVIRLFDRSVELGQFPAGTPLYPVCRAWIGHSPAPAAPQEQAPPKAEDVLEAAPPQPRPGPARPLPPRA
ncbi:protein lin-37 homolog isoform X2 [Corvus hawaiiensis]|uniref:protein lin-37 homolog isoform X2 n=1 Tax=Corvus hawaiiensis TaxID=134902 RepID=UPI002019C7BA|nr:protein lin-37 homolog isoform X2 [Corvus hawaiiensis]